MATVVKGNLKPPFLIATTLRCREGATPLPGLLHFTLDPYLIMLSVKQGSIKDHFLSLWYDLTWDWTPVSWTIGEHFTLQRLGFGKEQCLSLYLSIGAIEKGAFGLYIYIYIWLDDYFTDQNIYILTSLLWVKNIFADPSAISGMHILICKNIHLISNVCRCS